MADPVSNYGTLLKTGAGGPPLVYTAIANVTTVNPPKIASSTVDTTSHGSGGSQTKIGSGLTTVEPMTLSINYTSDDTLADSVGDTLHFQIEFPGSVTWTFDGVITGFQPGGADSQSPDTLTADIEIDPCGVPVIA